MKIPFYRTHSFHKQYLKVTGFLVAGFGPVCFLGTMPEFAEAGRWILDLLSWPLDGQESLHDSTARFLAAILGGFLLGYGVTIWCLSSMVYNKSPEMVRRSVLIGLCSWFVLDSLGSITGGHASNVAWNAVILLFFVGPLWLPAKEV